MGLSLNVRHQINEFLGRRNRVPSRQPHSAPVHQRIAGHAAQHPRSIAIQSEGVRLSYSELNQEANQLARRLQLAGVGRSSVVAVSIEPSADLVISLLAVLKTGAAYVAVDPGFTADHQALLFAGTHAGLLVTRTEQSKALPFGIPVIDCRDGAGSSDNLNLLIEPGTPAAILPGNGTGTVLTHWTLSESLAAIASEQDFDSSGTMFSGTAGFFDNIPLDVFLPLMCGGKLILCSPNARNTREILEDLRSSHATLMRATPATWDALAGAGWTANPGLRKMVTLPSPLELGGAIRRLQASLASPLGTVKK